MANAETNAMTSDLALVTAIRSGDRGAMAALYDRFSSIVYAVALRVLQDTGAAEDVLQDIFIQLWRNPGAFDSSRGNMGAWLAVIARNRAIDALRKRRPQDDIEDVIGRLKRTWRLKPTDPERWRKCAARCKRCRRWRVAYPALPSLPENSSFAPSGICHLPLLPTACAVGCNLTPLRGRTTC